MTSNGNMAINIPNPWKPVISNDWRNIQCNGVNGNINGWNVNDSANLSKWMAVNDWLCIIENNIENNK